MSFQKKKYLFIVLLLCIFTMKCTLAFAKKTAKDNYRILVNHSYEPNYPVYPHFNKLIAENLKKEKIKAELKFFYLDCEQFVKDEELDRVYHFIDSIQVWKPDLIILNEDQATYSTLACYHPFLKTIPIIFSGVNFPNWETLQDYSNVTGFWDKPDYVENAEMIERLLGRSRILFFHDETFLGKQVVREMAIQFTNKKNRFANTWIFNLLENNDSVQITKKYLPFLEQIEKRFSPPDTTTFYYINAREDKGKNVLWSLSGMVKHSVFVQTKYDFITMRIGQLASIPTFSVISEGVGYNMGVLGGYITTAEIQVEEEISYASRILKGESINELPITQSRKKYVVDWQELKRWNIPVSSIPANYEIINIPDFQKHRIVFICLFVVGALLILIFTVFFILRKKNKEREDGTASIPKEEPIVPVTDNTDTSDNQLSTDMADVQQEEMSVSPVITIKKQSKGDSPVVLIAEDNEGNYLLLKSVLKKYCTLIWAHNGLEAVNIANEEKIDIVLMDIKMPKMTGIEALKEIKKTQPDLPVIMQTAYAYDADKLLAYECGCSDFLTKPIDPQQSKSLFLRWIGDGQK